MVSSPGVEKRESGSDLVEKMEERTGEYPRRGIVNWAGRYLDEVVEEISSSSGTKGSAEDGI